MSNDLHERRRELAALLAATGALSDPAWRRAFEQVPRHVFVPAYYEDRDGRPVLVDSADPHSREKWLDAVYSDDLLVVQRLRLPDVTGELRTVPTSSSSMPSLMALMLELLEIEEAMRVLEIGTGTGYNAALLCHRLGDANVASVDIHPDLVAAARQRLAGLGYHPTLAVGDGADGLPAAAPFDRIISTAATPTIPAAWIYQLLPGGRIITDTRGDRAGGLVLLTKTDPDTVTGRFVSSRAHFMWLRPAADDPTRPGEPFLAGLDLRPTRHFTSTLAPVRLTDTLDFWFFAQLVLPGAALLPDLSLPDGRFAYLRLADGSFAMVSTTPDTGGTYTVGSAGVSDPWQLVEAAWQQWQDLGTPTPDRFGMTVTPDHQWTWLDTPERPVP